MASIKEYWAQMTPEERSKEMRRRMAVAGPRKRRKSIRQFIVKGRRRFTAAGYRAIQEGQRKRWARAKAVGSLAPLRGLTYPSIPGITQGSVKERLELIEAAVAQLRKDLGW